ncbi:c-type cytochrome [Parasulfuritortus cantonensis]|uniref:C-type cytochrome n=1 Tax=Parasulfuritortus cantonensis TaxID=2528202 RepID=A0A4R1BKW4_9PROT|nr:cytochrome c peroxidase [Parasulfuritortus cantonensis]TCJ18003.1 c-type cytochrome [Parasulfuritortus cantonensis]
MAGLTMRARGALILTLAGAAAGVGGAWWWYHRPAAGEAGVPEPVPVATIVDLSPVQPLPRSVSLDANQVELGRRLFHDVRLSSDDTVSCASCHAVDQYGVDGRRVSLGVRGQAGAVNAPTVYNSGFNFRQFWDGRAATLEDQVGGPVENPVEMASHWPQVLAKLRADATLQELARRAYGRELDEAAVRSAIATFERGLITPDSPFDRYLRGELDALDGPAKQGWQRFRDLGCIACHQGVNLGGNMYATLGAMGDYFGGRVVSQADYGLYNQTGREADRYKFKVPSLRNVAETAPYFHDGRIGTLDEAVQLMAKLQLGLDLEAADRATLVAFLRSLTGTPRGGGS